MSKAINSPLNRSVKSKGKILERIKYYFYMLVFIILFFLLLGILNSVLEVKGQTKIDEKENAGIAIDRSPGVVRLNS